jgi:hypothetical protein
VRYYFFERLGKSENCDSMMALIATLEIDDYEIKDGYMRPRNAFRSSDAHFGAPSGSSDSTRSGKPGSVPGDVFTALNLDTVFMNQPSSKLFLQRWEITDEFLDDQLLKLAKDNKKALDAFVQREAAKLGKIRNVFTKSKKNRESTRDERKECQPIVQLFILGLLQNARSEFGVKKSVAAANNLPLDLVLENIEHEDGVHTEVKCHGCADLFIFRGEDADSVTVEQDGDNVETVGEIKPPYASLYHTAHRAGLHQLICEVEALGQTLYSTPAICKGFITDLFVISVHMRVVSNDKAYHLVSHRVVEKETYVKHLILILCCDIPLIVMQSTISDAATIEVAAEVPPDAEQQKGPAAKSAPNFAQSVEPAPKRKSPRGKNANQPSSKLCAWQFPDDYDYDVEKDNLQFVLDHDARIRGVTNCVTSQKLGNLQQSFNLLRPRNDWH